MPFAFVSQDKCLPVVRRLLAATPECFAGLQNIVQSAHEDCPAELCAIALLFDDRLRTVAHVGQVTPSVDASVSFFQQTPPDGLHVPNTTADWRFKYHPLVVGTPHIRTYAGLQMVIGDCPVGSLVVASMRANAFSEACLGRLKPHRDAALALIAGLAARSAPAGGEDVEGGRQ